MFRAETSHIATLQPSATSWRTSSRPMPVPPPVTTAVLPEKSFIGWFTPILRLPIRNPLARLRPERLGMPGHALDFSGTKKRRPAFVPHDVACCGWVSGNLLEAVHVQSASSRPANLCFKDRQ